MNHPKVENRMLIQILLDTSAARAATKFPLLMEAARV
jgi:hypothetical protein